MRFRRSLVVLKDYLGDTVMASPLVRSVAKESEEIQVIGSAIVQQLLTYPDFHAKFFLAGNLRNVWHLLRLSRDIRRMSFDAAFVVNRSFRSALLIRLAGIPIRVGHATEGRASLLTSKVRYDLDRNEAECYLDLARSITLPLAFTVPELCVSNEERAQGLASLDGAAIGIQPGARHSFKQVPLHVWQIVGQQLISKGHRLAFFGGNEERAILSDLGFDGVDLVGKTSIRETIGALASLQLMIGGDTGVMHMAASVGTPTITMFGPTPAKKWGWFQPPHQVIEARGQDIQNIESLTVLEAVEKALCVLA